MSDLSNLIATALCENQLLDPARFARAVLAAGVDPAKVPRLRTISTMINRGHLRRSAKARQEAAALIVQAVATLARSSVPARLASARAHYNVCSFCTAHANVQYDRNGNLTRIFCESCIVGLGTRQPCRCGRARHVDAVGNVAAVCKWCHAARRPRGVFKRRVRA